MTLCPQKGFADDVPIDVIPTLPEEHEDIQDEVMRLGEITAKRESDKKYYLNSDLSITAEIHSNSIHCWNGTSWEDIDISIIEDKKNPAMPFRNKVNDFELGFARQYSESSELASIASEGKRLSFNPVGGERAQAEAGNSSASLVYRSVYPGIDLEYISECDHLKENIVINNYQGKNSFSFLLQGSGLQAKLKGKEVFFFDDLGEEIFIIPSPYMYDQVREESYNIEVDFEVLEKDSFLLTYTADEDWLTDKERVYPVIIDPVVWTKQSSAFSQTRDAFVDSNNPNTNYKYHQYLKSGKGTTLGKTRSYLMFPTLPEIGPADEIITAELSLCQSWALNSPVIVNLHQVTTPWDSGTLTWNNQPVHSTRVLDFESCKTIDWRTWDVTAPVKSWYKTGNNYGFLIKHAQETDSILDFVSSDHSVQGYRPILIINYRNISGLEGYLSYTSLDLGRSGSASVNNYNGNLVFAHNDVSLPGARMPVSISHIYNSDKNADDIGYGSGWRLNLSQTLFPVTIMGNTYMEYTDADGTVHHFLKQDGKYYLQTPGIFLDLTKKSDGTYTMKDGQDNKLVFNSNGYLAEIRNPQNDKILIGYNTSNKINKVTDGAGRITTLAYNTQGRLATISDPAERVLSLTYSSGNLSKITYPDDMQTLFTYSSSRIIKVTHPAGQYLQVEYFQNGDAKKLSCYGSMVRWGKCIPLIIGST